MIWAVWGAEAIVHRLQTAYSRQQDADCKTQTHRDAETQDEVEFLAAWWPPQGGPADFESPEAMTVGHRGTKNSMTIPPAFLKFGCAQSGKSEIFQPLRLQAGTSVLVRFGFTMGCGAMEMKLDGF